MIIWNHHDELSDDIVVKIKNIVQSNFQENEIFYSTYGNTEHYELLNDYYAMIQEKMMKDLGLFHRTKYHWHFWIQMYNNQTDGHGDHDHFEGDTIISWVHFIRTSNQKCFYFIDSNNHKTYPDYQSSGDMICFPSWASHGVDRVMENNFNRLIVAGNIRISYIEQSDEVFESNSFNDTILWTKRTF